MSEIYTFKGFTKKAQRKRYLKFLADLKKRKIKFEKASVREEGERYKVGGGYWDGATFYGYYGRGDILNYTIFNNDNTIPKDIIKKYTGTIGSWFKLVVSVLAILMIIIFALGIYGAYRWSSADVVYGTIEDIKEECYISRGVFSASNKVCETTDMKINGNWYVNKGSNVFHIGQSVELKCIAEECK